MLASLAALFLGACGGGGTSYVPVAVPVPAPKPDRAQALQPYFDQTLQWATCDNTILGKPLDWARFGGRLQCADVRVPLDYENPARGDASVAMMRLAGTDAANRRGALLFNPGGPGVDGLGASLGVILAFTDSDPATAKGRQQLRLLAEYDMVGFSPRGTGASTRLTCATNELEREVDLSPEGRTPQAIEDMLYNKRKNVEACKKNPITPYINSEATAQDMDLIRHLLGEQKLHYLGYSYGTWLGAWYASRFPDRVGRMVLDSSMDFTADGDRAERETFRSTQRVLDEVYAAYAARHPDAFNLGRTAEEVRAVLPALKPELRMLVTWPLVQTMYRAEEADDALLSIAAGRGLAQVMDAHPGADPDTIEAALATQVFVPAHSANDGTARAMAGALYEGLVAQAGAKPQNISLDDSGATYQAVMCNDTPGITNIDYWISLGDDYSRRYPLMGGMITTLNCAYWGGASVSKPPVSAMADLDILMVQSQYDKATDAEGAFNAFAALPRAHMVYVPGEHSHGLYPYDDQCVDTAVTGFLLGESPAQRETVCAAKPLALDAPASPAASSGSGFRNPAAASALIAEFKGSIARAANARYGTQRALRSGAGGAN